MRNQKIENQHQNHKLEIVMQSTTDKRYNLIIIKVIGGYMRFFLIFMLSVFMGSAVAITKCELNGKVSYQTAGCPEHAKAKYLVDDKYIEEDKLRKLRVKKVLPEKPATVSEEWPTLETESTDIQTQADVEQDKETVKSPPQVNVPRAFDYVNPKLSDMQKEIDEHNKELQELQSK